MLFYDLSSIFSADDRRRAQMVEHSWPQPDLVALHPQDSRIVACAYLNRGREYPSVFLFTIPHSDLDITSSGSTGRCHLNWASRIDYGKLSIHTQPKDSTTSLVFDSTGKDLLLVDISSTPDVTSQIFYWPTSYRDGTQLALYHKIDAPPCLEQLRGSIVCWLPLPRGRILTVYSSSIHLSGQEVGLHSLRGVCRLVSFPSTSFSILRLCRIYGSTSLYGLTLPVNSFSNQVRLVELDLNETPSSVSIHVSRSGSIRSFTAHELSSQHVLMRASETGNDGECIITLADHLETVKLN